MTAKIASMAPDDNQLMALTARNQAHLMNNKGADAATPSEVMGLGIATVNSLHRGIGNPTLSTLIGLAQFFNVSLSELTEMDLSAQNYKPSMARPIPLIKISDVNKFIDRSLTHSETYTTEIDGAVAQSCFAVSVNNDSLYPQFSAGTIFVVAGEETPCDGDVVLVKIGAHSPCLRKIFIDGDNYLFSPIALDSDISPSIYSDYQILGVVLKAIKKFSDR